MLQQWQASQITGANLTAAVPNSMNTEQDLLSEVRLTSRKE